MSTFQLGADLSRAFQRRLDERISVPGQVAHVLREGILSGALEPGTRIVETKIAKEFGIGQPTVREGLKTLEAEGLVRKEPHRGYRVTCLSIDETQQIFRLRIELEVLAAELAVENRAQWLPSEIWHIVDNLKATAQAGDVRAYYWHDLQFHTRLGTISRNGFLERALTQILVPLFAFNTMLRLHHLDIDLISNAEAHERIARAVTSEEAETAKLVCRRELENFQSLSLKLIEKSK